jgi:hypothetical protein
MSGESSKSTLKLWQEYAMEGYVTQLREVIEQDPLALADRLGFSRHLMEEGYALLLLLSPVARQDFSWRDTTRFSAGWVKERVYYRGKDRMRSSVEYVQRADQDRFSHYQASNYNSEKSWDDFLAEQEIRLNVRRGPDRIVKVLPFVRGTDGDYPDARRECAVQWELHTKKQFICVARIERGHVIRNGEFDASYVV